MRSLIKALSRQWMSLCVTETIQETFAKPKSICELRICKIKRRTVYNEKTKRHSLLALVRASVFRKKPYTGFFQYDWPVCQPAGVAIRNREWLQLACVKRHIAPAPYYSTVWEIGQRRLISHASACFKCIRLISQFLLPVLCRTLLRF